MDRKQSNNSNGKTALPKHKPTTREVIMSDFDKYPRKVRKVVRESPYPIIIVSEHWQSMAANPLIFSQSVKTYLDSVVSDSARATYGPDYPADIKPVRC